MEIRIDRSAPVPLPRQIRLQLERLIREGILGPGVKLPASRELAQDLGVNRTTVTLAYEELVSEGIARAHVGQGTFVAAPEATPQASGPGLLPGPDWSGLFSKGSQLAAVDGRRRELSSQPVRPGGELISFAGGMPDSGLFPTEAFRRVLNRVIRAEGPELLQYYPVGGYPPLRQFLSRYLLGFGVEARPEEILIVNGSQQGLDLIARVLLDPGDFVAMEEPSYPRAIQVFRAFGAQLLPIPLGSDGLRLDLLERLLGRHAPKLLYCQPSAHNPTGLTMSPGARRGLLELAGRHRVPVVEDGFDGSLCFGERPPGPLKAGDGSGLVICIGTFSKILFPGLRLGWLVAPAAVLERLELAKQLSDIHTSPLIQAAVFHFCQRRLLERHLTRCAPEYSRRRVILLRALESRMPAGVTWTEPRGGFSLLLALPEEIDAAALLPRALDHGVAFTPGSVFFVDGGGESTLRLSFSTISTQRIDEGIKRLADVVRQALSRPTRRGPVERSTVPLV
ncbi:MAG: PLP-dependent aminotransferase family protein [Candidatus Rokubacteria bacterium]|nr:PLP-dependent aminotransferase family protein [Candidatus Rokubacteria bacterium]